MKRAIQCMAVSVLAIVTLSVCQLSLQSELDRNTSASGSLQLTVGGESALRASQLGGTVEPIVPDSEDLEIVVYVLTAVGPGDETETVETPDTESPTFSLGPLVPGEWDITVEGLRSGVEGDEVLVQATTTVTIVADETTSANLSPTPISGEGQLSVTVEWPPDGELDSVSVEGVQSAVLENINNGGEQPLEFDPAGESSAEFSGDVDSGYYVLTVGLENDDEQLLATRRASVHVYAGVATSGTVAFSASSLQSPPGSPQSVTATQAGEDEAAITVSWSEPAEGAAPVGFLVERKVAEEGEASYERVAALEAPVDEFIDEEVPTGSWYTYRIIAFNASGESEPGEGPAIGLFAISGMVEDADDESGIEDASVTGILDGDDLFEATTEAEGSYETVFTVEDRSADNLPGSLTVRAAAPDYGSDELIVDFGDAMEADFSLVAADEGDVPAPLLSLLIDIDDGDGSLRPNFDLQLEVVMPAGLSGDETLWVNVRRDGEAGDFEEHDPEQLVVFRPPEIPFNGSIVVEAYIEADGGAQSEVVEESYQMEYFALSVHPDGDDESVGSNTEPLASVGEAIRLVDEAGGNGEISLIRIAAGDYPLDPVDGGGLVGELLGLFETSDETEAALGIDDIVNLTIAGSYGDGFYESQEGETVLDAEGQADHVFYINESDEITLRELTIAGGTGLDGNVRGGGIFVRNSRDVTLTSGVIVRDNAAVYGGGVAVIESERFTTDPTVIISNNNAEYGGGLYVAGGSEHEISGYIGDGPTDEPGDGMNTADVDGGGLMLDGGINHLVDAVVRFNVADAGSGFGGGVFINAGAGHTVRGIVEGNHADDGGGVAIAGTGSGHVVDADVTGNIAESWGGGVSTTGGENYQVNGTISYNVVVSFEGGGVSIFDGFGHTVDAEVYGNESADLGAGLAVNFVDTFSVGGSYRNNIVSGSDGGGMSLYETDNITFLEGLRVRDNTADRHGGGIYIFASTFGSFAEDVEITGNTANANEDGTGEGGGLYNWAPQTGQPRGDLIPDDVLHGDPEDDEDDGWFFDDNSPNDVVQE